MLNEPHNATPPESGKMRDLVTEVLKVLNFYGEPSNWRTTGHLQIDAHDTRISRDGGAMARTLAMKLKSVGTE